MYPSSEAKSRDRVASSGFSECVVMIGESEATLLFFIERDIVLYIIDTKRLPAGAGSGNEIWLMMVCVFFGLAIERSTIRCA